MNGDVMHASNPHFRPSKRVESVRSSGRRQAPSKVDPLRQPLDLSVFMAGVAIMCG
jgi:hypothetical protein